MSPNPRTYACTTHRMCRHVVHTPVASRTCNLRILQRVRKYGFSPREFPRICWKSRVHSARSHAVPSTRPSIAGAHTARVHSYVGIPSSMMAVASVHVISLPRSQASLPPLHARQCLLSLCCRTRRHAWRHSELDRQKRKPHPSKRPIGKPEPGSTCPPHAPYPEKTTEKSDTCASR